MGKNDSSNSKKKDSKENDKENSSGLKTQTKHGILAIVFFVFALIFLMSAFDMAGVAGKLIYEKLSYLLGVGYILLPILLLLLGFSYVKSETPYIGLRSALSGGSFLLSSLGIIDIVSGEHSGGLLGEILSTPLVALFDKYASAIFLGAILIISILVIFDTKLNLAPFFGKLWNLLAKKKEPPISTLNEAEIKEVEKSMPSKEETEEIGEKIKNALGVGKTKEKSEEDSEEEIPIKKRKVGLSNYVPPPLSLLEEDHGKPNTGDIKANANIIKRTLANFGIEVEMDEITVGPTVTRYALKPAEGVKLSRIVGLQNDLALSLAAHPIRIEAPIPGKSLVGIEIPNKTKSIVGLATLLADEKFQNSIKPLTTALGRSISGKAIFGNLAKMPHCLVAGTTGSGKSVTIHSMITSLLYRNGPDDLKFIMIDPKRVELTLYNKIPHLLTPVITDAKKTILALKWAAKEMDRRYDILEAESVRDIESYHANIWGKKKVSKTPSSSPLAEGENEDSSPDKGRSGGVDRLPYIVIIIDELADIMSSYPRELESAIVRLAQMSRAVGIHLILSTQRPEVNVITGLIKANIPARVALKVSSQVDSRTILDAGGAEKLLGAGDMLYSSGEAQPERLQSAFISEAEVKKVVKYLGDTYRDEISEEITLTTGSISVDKGIFESTLENEDGDDELYEEARLCVVEAGRASTSYLQRKLKLGYARAARLMDKLEERGVIGPGDGAKPREVLEKITQDENQNNVI